MDPAVFRPSLSVRDLTVKRGERTLFAGLSFDAAPGDAVLVRGPNGAGKTSLLLALAGFVRPESGTVSYGERGELARAIHLMLPLPGLKAKLGVAENLGFWRTVNGADGVEVEPALDRVGLGGLGGLEAGHLSTGQLRRLALARLLVTRRPLWLLDEPTSALDTQGDALVADLIGAHRADGGMVVAATHHDLALTGAVQSIDLGQAA
jgi:heme exporter protein A